MWVPKLIVKVQKNALKGTDMVLVGRTGRRQVRTAFSPLCRNNYSEIRVRICEVGAKGDNLVHLIFTFTTWVTDYSTDLWNIIVLTRKMLRWRHPIIRSHKTCHSIEKLIFVISHLILFGFNIINVMEHVYTHTHTYIYTYIPNKYRT